MMDSLLLGSNIFQSRTRYFSEQSATSLSPEEFCLISECYMQAAPWFETCKKNAMFLSCHIAT